MNEGRSGKGRGCLKCICCCYCILFLVILIITSILIYVYTFYRPRAPSYRIIDFTLTSFDATPSLLGVDSRVKSSVEVTVNATNPNDHIGFEYMKGSSVTVKYDGVLLCSGELPNFRQEHNNKTVFKIHLKGDSSLDPNKQQSLMMDDSKAMIPLVVDVEVPISLILGDSFKLKDFSVQLKCRMVVDHLTPGKKTNILSSSYSYKVDF